MKCNYFSVVICKLQQGFSVPGNFCEVLCIVAAKHLCDLLYSMPVPECAIMDHNRMVFIPVRVFVRVDHGRWCPCNILFNKYVLPTDIFLQHLPREASHGPRREKT